MGSILTGANVLHSVGEKGGYMSYSTFETRDPNFEARMHGSFEEQAFMGFLGAIMAKVTPGAVEIHLPYQKGLTQQYGYFHGGAIGALADVAGGYAAFSLMAAEDAILTIEYKVNMLAPAVGEMLVARGRVVRPGRQITVAHTDIFSLKGGVEKLVATSLGTFMTMVGAGEMPAGS